ncbi:hypothetical protein [Nocardia nova]|uniref:hypothetical protein n=1 Tax=Nocardia nova TaxID=37330 RepID=UPI0015E29DB2|nr:hypothetical protein [Nocardia nova]
MSLGRAFIANPDLVSRIRHDRALAPVRGDGLYGRGPTGYTDYPSWSDRDERVA